MNKPLHQFSFSAINFVFLSAIYLSIDFESKIIGPVLWCLGATNFFLLILSFANSFRRISLGLLISLMTVLSFVCALDVFRLFQGTLPRGILDNLASDESANARSNTPVEFFEYSPYIRFKPYAKIRSAGYPGRGTENLQFVYEWTTDRLGFKNDDRILDSKIRAVFVGDSFTEGMGVKTDETMPSQLTRSGVVTYNLGVQGFAPIQMAGAFEKFGLPLFPEILLVGYTAGTFEREKYYVNGSKQTSNVHSTHSGIDRIASPLPQEITQQSKHVAFAVFLFIKRLWGLGYIPQKQVVDPNLILTDVLKDYEQEILEGRRQVAPEFLNSKEFTLFLEALLQLQSSARVVGAKMVVIYFPPRSEIYARFAISDIGSNTFSQIESRKIAEFCRARGIFYRDMSDSLLDHMRSLSTLTYDALPYLEIDGHPSKVGFKIMSEDLLKSGLLQLR